MFHVILVHYGRKKNVFVSLNTQNTQLTLFYRVFNILSMYIDTSIYSRICSTCIYFVFFFLSFLSFFLNHHFSFRAQLVGGFTLSDLLDKPWSQLSSLLPPGTCLQFYRAYRSAFPLLVDFHRMLLTHALALSANQLLCKKKSLPTSMCTR